MRQTETAKKIARRFWPKVAVTKHPQRCWLWTASKNRKGYGQITLPGGRPATPILAHRASWIIHHGMIPEGLHVLHTCDTPGCVRPSHLYLGTQVDNSRDAVERGRVARGGRLPQAKLVAADVFAIRRAFTAFKRSIAKRYEVSENNIELILKRRRWKHLVDGPSGRQNDTRGQG